MYAPSKINLILNHKSDNVFACARDFSTDRFGHLCWDRSKTLKISTKFA